MEEKRRSRRYPIDLKLEISSLFKQDNVKVENVHAPIEVVNISRTGIGFQSESVLPLNFYFNAKIMLGNKDNMLYCVIQIIRIRTEGTMKLYGCEFVGLAPVLSYIFEEFEHGREQEEEQRENG